MTAFRDKVLVVYGPDPRACRRCGQPAVVREDGSLRVHFAGQADTRPCLGSWPKPAKAGSCR